MRLLAGRKGGFKVNLTLFKIIYYNLTLSEPLIYEPARNGATSRKARRRVTAEPTPRAQFSIAELYLARFPFCSKSHHDLRRKRPRLTPLILYVAYLKAGLLHHLTSHALFQRFPRLHESGHKGIDRVAERARMHKQGLIVAGHQYHYCRRYAGKYQPPASAAH